MRSVIKSVYFSKVFFLGVLLIIILSLVSLKNSSIQTQKQDTIDRANEAIVTKQKEANEPTKEENKEPAVVSEEEISPDGKFVAIFNAFRDEKEKKYRLSFSVNARRWNEDNVEQTENFEPFWKTSVPFDDEVEANYIKVVNSKTQQSRYLGDDGHSDFIEWSNDGKTVVLLFPNKLMVFEFSYERDKEQIFAEGTDEERKVVYDKFLKLSKADEIPLDFPISEENSKMRLFFSDDDRYFYLRSTEASMYKFDTTNYLFDLLNIEFVKSEEVFPVTGSSGFGYWQYHAGPDREQTIVVHEEDNEKKYVIPDSSTIDYLGKVLFSPDRSKVCFEWGSSGYWGYEVLDLLSNEVIDSGQQYSYCSKWTNNNTLIVIEDHYHEATNYIIQLNTITGEKTVLGSFRMTN